ncbi:hypothetical protein NEOKW01_1524 [Nematocida sp. AWRm80]|nr:hypothetical protein NEOKW01_1524 [Nematocida sp. AWRm80]
MQTEYRSKDYGLKESKVKDVFEVATGVPSSYAVLLLDGTTGIYAKEGVLYKKQLPEGPEKTFASGVGTETRIVYDDGVIAAYNKEGKVLLLDKSGSRLGEINTGDSPIKDAAFLSGEYICVGGLSCRLRVYSISEKPIAFEEVFNEYIDSISANDSYLAVALSSGEIHLYQYKIQNTVIGVSSKQTTRSISITKVSILQMNKSSVVHFVSSTNLFIGVSTGTGYIYSFEHSSIIYENAMHSKEITQISTQGEYIITSSSDGRLRVSTQMLREVCVIHIGSPILTFSAMFISNNPQENSQPIFIGAQYLIVTSAGSIVLYRDKWTDTPAEKEAPIKATRPKTLSEQSKISSSTVESIQTISAPERTTYGKYERLIKSFQYRKALLHAAIKKERNALASVMEYLHKIDYLLQTLKLLPDEQIYEVTDLAIDMLREKRFYDLSHSVLLFVSTILENREHPETSPLYALLDKASQEVEEELSVHSLTTSLSAYLSSLVFPVERRE